MDITSLFKACVKTVKTKNRAFGIGVDKTRIFPCRSEKSEFALKLKELVEPITRLRHFLLKHRTSYLNFSGYMSDTQNMTDEERDEIENGAERIIGNSSYLICKFKRDWKTVAGPSQLLEHYRKSLDLVEIYLKAVCEIYSEQKFMRVRRAVDLKKLSKLEPDDVCASSNMWASDLTVQQGSQSSPGSEASPAHYLSRSFVEFSEDSIDDYDADLSLEELQIFQKENLQMYDELSTLADEVRQIQRTVVCIAELQDVFTEKVLQQEEHVERIATTVIGSTENVKEGNQQLRTAIQRNAGLRAWALFFFITLSFSLLFLHWYND